jgi:hypothetical protein
MTTIKCDQCGVEYDPANLSTSIIHQHNPDSPELAAMAIGIKGIQTGKTFTPEQSSNVKEIRYSKEKSILQVTFRNESIYQYANVPEEKWNEVLAAPSIGKYIGQIKSLFECKKLILGDKGL